METINSFFCKSKKIRYIGYYDSESARRLMSPAAVTKMNYISQAIANCGVTVEIISCGVLASESFPSSTEQISNNVYVHYGKTIKSGKSIIERIVGRLYENIYMLLYLLWNIKRDETVIVYHSLLCMRAVNLAKKVKRFHMILEVEEIYNDVFLKSKTSKKSEQKFIQSAEAYIFPTKLLNDKCNIFNKPFVLIHGTYQVSKLQPNIFNDKDIHIIYAGILDSRKGGNVAVDVAKCLPDNYHIHILGYGSKQEVEDIKHKIERQNKESSAKVTFEGLLSGDQYIQFLQSCSIGLCPQDPSASFTMTSFPSKVLSYLSNGLAVVSVRISSIESSEVGDLIHYYDIQEPESIANCILNVNLGNRKRYINRIEKLNSKFKEEIKDLINRVNNKEDE